jgi:hypothetical protein
LTFPLTAAGLVALHSCGCYEGDRVLAGRQFLRRFRPDLRDSSPVPAEHYLYGHYYAAQALRQLGGAEWSAWYAAIRDELCRGTSEGKGRDSERPVMHQADGSWKDHHFGTHYGTAMACIILQLPRNLLPILQK